MTVEVIVHSLSRRVAWTWRVGICIAFFSYYSIAGSASINANDLLDPADTESAIDLTELPLGIEWLRRAGLAVQDASVKKQLNEELQSLQRIIEESATDSGLGCLLKIRMYGSPTGNIAIPEGQLIALEGTGRTPIDALTKSWMSPAIVASDAIKPPLENQSYYVWIKKEGGTLKAGIIPRELRAPFEQQANAELERRTRLASVDAAAKSSGIQTIARDEFWSDMAQKHLAGLHDTAEQRRLMALVNDFEVAEYRFREAYQEYSVKEQELQDEQRRVRTLQTLSRIGGIVSSAINLGEFTSSEKHGANVTAPAVTPDSNRFMLEYHERQVDFLRGDTKEWSGQIEVRGATLQQLNEQLVNAFQKNGFQIPDSKKSFTVSPKP